MPVIWINDLYENTSYEELIRSVSSNIIFNKHYLHCCENSKLNEALSFETMKRLCEYNNQFIAEITNTEEDVKYNYPFNFPEMVHIDYIFK